MRHAHPLLTFEKQSESQTTNKCFILFRLFWSKILSWRSRLSRTTRDPALKSGKFQAPKNCVFSVFPAKILARFSCFLFQHEHEHRQKKLFFAPAIYTVLIYTPKEAHSRFFVTGESVFARQMLAKKSFSVFLAWPACSVLLLARRACVLLVLRTQNPNKCSANQKKKISKVAAILKCESCIAHRIWARGPAPWPIREKTVRFAFLLSRSQKLANL